MSSIVIDKNISSGSPTIKDRRLTVFNVVSKIYYESNLQIALEDYEISLETATNAVDYCSSLSCQEDKELIKFCSGCILRTLQDGWNFNKNDYTEILCNNFSDNISISKDGNQIFLGSIQQLEDNDFGKIGWLLAEEDKIKYPELGSVSK